MPDAEAPPTSTTVENVRVVVRVRPMEARERVDGAGCVTVDAPAATVSVVKNGGAPEPPRVYTYDAVFDADTSQARERVDGAGCVTVDAPAATVSVVKNGGAPEPPRVYTYDAVFDADTSQMDIYLQTASPIVEQVLKGYNGTIFAYGQTGTGKTYTMAGSGAAPELKGIIPNSFAHIFSHIAQAKDDEKFLVCVTYLEIYNEEVRDLLGNDPHQSLEVKERPDIGVFVKGLTGYVVHNADELEKIMSVGNKNRHIGATAMNTESSRSHAIFSITVESSKKGDDGKMHVKMGKLHLVDLAGSERQSKTQATGTRLKEATKINQSLSVLGNVISALVDGKSTHIPYRNSKLTRLLQDSLGGNSKTVMIATIGPADNNYVETISTLRYASRAKSIENKTHVNSEPGDALLTRFQQEIEQLKKQLEEANELVEEEEEEALTEEELTDDTLTDPELDLQPEERKRHRKIHKEEKMKQSREKARHARKVLEEKKAELQRTKKQQEELKDKLQRLESKVLVGGENLLDKADTQRRLLEQAAKELEQRHLLEQSLQNRLLKKEAERLDLEERYSSLQEENAAKTRKLKRAVQLLNSAKAELADQQREQQREMEGILDSIRALQREIQLADLVLEEYIPKEYQALIDQYVHWSEQLGEWQVKCVAYTGNNMHLPRRQRAHKHKYNDPPDLSDRYLSYSSAARAPSRLAAPLRPQSAAQRTRT